MKYITKVAIKANKKDYPIGSVIELDDSAADRLSANIIKPVGALADTLATHQGLKNDNALLQARLDEAQENTKKTNKEKTK